MTSDEKSPEPTTQLSEQQINQDMANAFEKLNRQRKSERCPTCGQTIDKASDETAAGRPLDPIPERRV